MIAARELTAAGIWIRILAAVLFGGILGIERGMKNRPAGLRTYMLVCIGACVVMLVNQYVYQVYHTGDPVRMGAQVISGIGFLGAGTIVVTPHNQIRGLTTAAGLWAAACVGLALGLGLYEIALAGGAAVFFGPWNAPEAGFFCSTKCKDIRGLYRTESKGITAPVYKKYAGNGHRNQ